MGLDDKNRPLYMISIAAELAGVHPQTLLPTSRRVWSRRDALVVTRACTPRPISIGST